MLSKSSWQEERICVPSEEHKILRTIFLYFSAFILAAPLALISSFAVRAKLLCHAQNKISLFYGIVGVCVPYSVTY